MSTPPQYNLEAGPYFYSSLSQFNPRAWGPVFLFDTEQARKIGDWTWWYRFGISLVCWGDVPPTSRCQPSLVFDLHSEFSRAGGPLALLLADKKRGDNGDAKWAAQTAKGVASAGGSRTFSCSCIGVFIHFFGGGGVIIRHSSQDEQSVQF